MFGLDPTVQVAILGAIGTIGAAMWAFIRESFLKEKLREQDQLIITLSERDRDRVDQIIDKLNEISNSIDRIRLR